MATTLLNGGGIITSFHSASGLVTVDGKEYPFDFSERFGPLWLRKDGEPKANQIACERHPVWPAFEEWLALYQDEKKAHNENDRRDQKAIDLNDAKRKRLLDSSQMNSAK